MTIILTLEVELELDDDETTKEVANDVYVYLNQKYVVREVDITFETTEEEQ